MFTPRQFTTMVAMRDFIKEVREEIDGMPLRSDFAETLTSRGKCSGAWEGHHVPCSIAIDRCADFNCNSLCGLEAQAASNSDASV